MAHETENHSSPFAVNHRNAEGQGPSEQDLFNFFENHLREVGILKEELTSNKEKLSEYIEGMLKNQAVRQQVTLLWKAHRLEERRNREEEERREINLAIDKLVLHVREKLEDNIKRSGELTINHGLMSEIKEPTPENVRSQIGKFISELGLSLEVEQVSRIDARDLTKRFLLKEAELKAKEEAKEAEAVLNSLIAKMPKVSPANNLVGMKPKLVEPLWRRAISQVTDEDDLLKGVAKESEGTLPSWIFEDKAATRDLLGAARGFLCKHRRKAQIALRIARAEANPNPQKITELDEKSERIQKVIVLITGIYFKLFHVDPAHKDNWCDNDIYNENEKRLDDFFAVLIGKAAAPPKIVPVPSTVKDQETCRESKPDERKQVLDNTKTKLREVGFREIDIDQLARKITKHYNGDIRAAALGRREMMSQNLSEDEQQILEEQYRKLAEAAGVSLEELEKEFNLRKEEQRTRDEAVKAEKERKLAPHVAPRLSANQQRRQHFANRPKKDKKQQRDSGISRHRNKE